MGRATCLCLLACLTVGLAVPVPESTSPSNEKDLLNIILNANSEDNDIDGPSVKGQVTVKSKDYVTTALPLTDAAVEEETQQPSEAIQEAALPEGSTTTEKVEEPALEPKVNQTELPKEQTALEPAEENIYVVPEVPYPQELLVPEEHITFEEKDEPIFDAEEDVFEGLLNSDDQIIPDEEQMPMENDGPMIPIYEVPSPFEPETEEQIPTEDEVVLVLDERVQFMPNPEEEEMFEGEEEGDEDEETGFQVPIQPEEEIFIVEEDEVYPEEEEIYPEEGEINPEETGIYPEGEIYEGGEINPGDEIYSINEEESFMLSENPFMPNTEEHMMPDYDDSEDIMTYGNEDEEEMPIMGMPEVAMINREVIVVPIAEEPFIPDSEDESVFGSTFEEESPEDLVQESEVPIYFDAAGNPESIPVIPDDSDDFSEDDRPFPDVPYFERVPIQTPEYYIPDESFSPSDDIDDEESSFYPENENDSFIVGEEMPEMNIDVAEVLLNERMPMENDNNTPALVNILMIKAKPSFSEGNPIIDVISTDLNQMPPQFPFMVDEEEPVESEIPENDDDNIIVINESELSESDSLLPVDEIVQQPIFFPEELPRKHNLPVFPSDWREDAFKINIFGPSGSPDFSYDAPTKSISSYYGQSQDQSTFRPASFPQFFIKEESEVMSGMMNSDMQSQMPDTMPLSSPADISIFGNEQMPQNEQSGHFHMTDEILQDSSYPNAPSRFDSFVSPAMASQQGGATSQDFRGPNTFPLNFGNSNIDRDSMGFNIFDTASSNYGFQGPYQQDQQFNDGPPFLPALRRNQPFRFDYRYPMANQPSLFNSYGPYNLDYPEPYRIASYYSQVGPLNRYGINQPIGNQFGNLRPFNYPRPLW